MRSPRTANSLLAKLKVGRGLERIPPPPLPSRMEKAYNECPNVGGITIINKSGNGALSRKDAWPMVQRNKEANKANEQVRPPLRPPPTVHRGGGTGGERGGCVPVRPCRRQEILARRRFQTITLTRRRVLHAGHTVSLFRVSPSTA